VRHAAPAALFVLMVASACGKVGDPKPPIVRTPESIKELRAVQSGYNLILTWTNPERYVDNNPVTDLAFVRILRNGVEVDRVPVSAAGQPQSYGIDVANSLDADLMFSVQVETQRKRLSPVSTVMVRPVQVPGSPRGLTATVDQFRITLTWEAPERNPNLAEMYIVQRADRPGSSPAPTTRYEDNDYEADKTYTYTVTAARANGSISGLAGTSVMVTATDKTRPKAPAGLQIEPAGTGVLLKWTPNQERDKKEYRVYRSDQSEPIAVTPVELFADPGYKSGLSYQLEAVDFFDNRSDKSPPQPGP
jgi:fibronectin type 3 domain-containing protein